MNSNILAFFFPIGIFMSLVIYVQKVYEHCIIWNMHYIIMEKILKILYFSRNFYFKLF